MYLLHVDRFLVNPAIAKRDNQPMTNLSRAYGSQARRRRLLPLRISIAEILFQGKYLVLRLSWMSVSFKFNYSHKLFY